MAPSNPGRFRCRFTIMGDSVTLRFVHWKDDSAYLGYLEDYPDYITQGESEEDLKEHLIDLYRDLTSGELPYVKKIDELVVTA